MNRIITTVTITGADDATRFDDMARLSEEYFFVEWGILYSASARGAPRYPNVKWCSRLAALHLKKSLHACGKFARATMAGDAAMFHEARAIGATRLQINGYVPTNELLVLAGEFADVEVIFQARDEGALDGLFERVDAHCAAGSRASVLYDPSGGRGVRRPIPEVRRGPIGFAGGITPDNIEEVIAELPRHVPCWIDMESGVRTDDRLDVEKVRRVLSTASEYVMEP